MGRDWNFYIICATFKWENTRLQNAEGIAQMTLPSLIVWVSRSL